MSDKVRDEEDIFRDIAARVHEMYPDYLLMVRCGNGSRAWKFSDPNWALGAMQRTIKRIETDDFIQTVEAEDGAG